MADITVSMVKELREQTGAGMMDCKTALSETDGDLEAAVDWLRTKGLSKAAKKADRVAAEGLVSTVTDGQKGAVVEVNSETDFVARNDQFQNMVSDIAKVALSVDGDFDKLITADYPGAGKSIQDHVAEMVGTIGENMSVRRSAGLSVEQGVVTSYLHGQVVEGQGKIGVLVALESPGDKEKLAALGKQIAMHVAATNPLALSTDDLSKDEVEREREVLITEARESGKPEEIVVKMVEGRVKKFLSEVSLLDQPFVKDGDTKVGKLVADAGTEVLSFVRYEVGEGIEVEETDFAAEVAAQVAGND